MDSSNTSSSSNNNSYHHQEQEAFSSFLNLPQPPPPPPPPATTTTSSSFFDPGLPSYLPTFNSIHNPADNNFNPISTIINLPSSSSSQPLPPRTSKKRTRASRRAPTTVLTTDTSNFRAMVQQFTGFPVPPFASSSSLQASFPLMLPRPRLDHLTPPFFLSRPVAPPSSLVENPFVHPGLAPNCVDFGDLVGSFVGDPEAARAAGTSSWRGGGHRELQEFRDRQEDHDDQRDKRHKSIH